MAIDFTTEPTPPDGYVQRMLDKATPTEEDLIYRAEKSTYDEHMGLAKLQATREIAQKQLEAIEKGIQRRKDALGITDAPANHTPAYKPIQLMSELDPTPPAPPWLGIIGRRGATIIHGTGGTGKGVLAVKLIDDLIALMGDDFRVAIIDAEKRPYEWKPRMDALGMSKKVQDQIAYITPLSIPIWDQLDAIKGYLSDIKFKPDIVIVDSIAKACGLEDMSTGDTSLTAKYMMVMDELCERTLSLAHNNRNGKIFGSAKWNDDARFVWAYETRGKERVLTNTKRNDGGDLLPPREVMITKWTGTEVLVPAEIIIRPYAETMADKAVRIVLMEMSYDQIYSALKKEAENLGIDPPPRNSMVQGILRAIKQGRLIKTGEGNNAHVKRAEPTVSHEQMELFWTCHACKGQGPKEEFTVIRGFYYHRNQCEPSEEEIIAEMAAERAEAAELSPVAIPAEAVES